MRCRTAVPPANPASPIATNGIRPLAPSTRAITSAAAPLQAGHSNRLDNSSGAALRQGNTGATAINASRPSPIGPDIRSKYGSPIDRVPRLSASTTRGNVVPSNMTNVKAAKRMLLASSAPSLDMARSIRPSPRNRSPRQAISPIDSATTTPNPPSSTGPTVPSEKACTELTTPDRVRKVP